MADKPTRVDAIGAQMAAAMAASIENDPGNWTRSWNTLGAAIPHNPVSEAVYSGINRFVLGVAAIELDHPTGAWATYKQWQSKECQVRRGTHGVHIVRAFEHRCCKDPDCDRGSDCGRRSRWGLRAHTVFNAAQVDGDVPRDERFSADVAAPEWDHAAITEMFGALGAAWHHGGNRAYYSLTADEIHTPVPEAFHSAGGYASTVAHEHVHWTGHTSRLSRPYFQAVEAAIAAGARAREELVAELGAVVVCNSLGLEHEPVDNHAAYLAHWASHLRSDNGPALVFAASAAATKAATFIVDRIDAHRCRADAAAEQTQDAAHPGQLVLLPAVAAPEAPERPTAAPEAPARPAAASEQQPVAVPEAPERPVAARAEANGSPSDDASQEERLMVARWMMARAKQQGADTERSAAQIAVLLDLDPRDLDGPAQTAPARRRALEVTL